MACDISILCAEDASPWAGFLQKKLTDDKYGCHVNVAAITVQDGAISQPVVDKHRSAHVQVLMVSPDLVEPIVEIQKPELLPNFAELFPRQSKSVAVFCGCDENDEHILDLLSKHFRNFRNKWSTCVAGVGEGEVNWVLVTILEVLEQEVNNGTDSGIPDDIYLIPPPPRSLGNQLVRVLPERLVTVGEDMYVIFEDAVQTPVVINTHGERDTEVICKQLSSHIFSFKLPSDWKAVESYVDLTVFCNGAEFGTLTVQFESKLDSLNRLLKDVFNPLEVLSMALNMDHTAAEDCSALDIKLKQILQSNFPAGNFQNLFDVSSQMLKLGRNSDKETPTVLHFAAKFGLKELCAELLTCPGAAQAFTVENVRGLLPNDIAGEEGHDDLARFLTDYMHTGVPIAMVYSEMITTEKVSGREAEKKVKNADAPPPPCPGGNYSDTEKRERTTQSIYMDMGRVSSGAKVNTSARSSGSSQSLSPKTVSPKTSPSTSPRQSKTSQLIHVPPASPRAASHPAPVPHSRLSKTPSPHASSGYSQAPLPRRSTTSSQDTSPQTNPTSSHDPPPPPHNVSSQAPPPQTTSSQAPPPNITPSQTPCLQSTPSPTAPPAVMPRSDKASSTPNRVCEAIAEEKEASERSRSHSESDVSSTSSRDSPDDSEARGSVFEIPQPFTPAPILSAKEISKVSTTHMSQKDQALRNILQSAADGSVSMEEAKLLVNNWNEQYRRSQSTFEGKWNAIRNFQNTAEEENDGKTPTAVKPRKSFLSKMFKRKTKSTSELTSEKHYRTKKKPGRYGVTSMASPTTSQGSDTGRNVHELASSYPGFQRQNSIRVSRAMEDGDLADMPDVPNRSLSHSPTNVVKNNKPSVPNKLPLIKSNLSNARLMKQTSRSEASPPGGADHMMSRESLSPLSPRHMLGAEISPRLPDPD